MADPAVTEPRRSVNRVWRWIFTLSETYIVTVIFTLYFESLHGYDIDVSDHPVIGGIIGSLYIIMDMTLLIFSPFFFQRPRLEALAPLGVTIAIIGLFWAISECCQGTA